MLSMLAAVVVALSWLAPGRLAPGWLAPEHESPPPASTRPVNNISYQQCAPEFWAAPNYGTRALTYDCTR
ncbi:hypothetical protein MCEMAEM6B_00024 [Mycobacteriaceae bacterium]